MIGRLRAVRDPRARAAVVALAITLAIQVFTSLAATATSVLVPEIGRDLGVSPKLIGVFVGLMYAGGMSASLVSGGFIHRFGAIRVSQACVLLCAGGLATMAALPPALLPALAVVAILIGLGYGPITPASSQILVRTASPARMALTFSIKQTGVPLGAALAGAVLPIIALRVGWREGFAAVAGLGIVIAIAAQTVRPGLDAGRVRTHALSVAGVLTPLRRVLRTPALAELAFTGLVYAALQVCLMSFLIIYLTESLGFSLLAAGFALTAANLGGIFGRILWGAIADHLVPPRLLLGLIGVIAGGSAWLTVAFSAQWPTLAVLAVCIVFGMTAIGWNGVQLAELARNAPAGQEGAITGASGFISFGGVLVGPPAFALVSALTSGYRSGFATFGTIAVGVGALMFVRHRK